MTERSLLNEAGGGGASGRTFKIFLPEQRSVAQLKSIVGRNMYWNGFDRVFVDKNVNSGARYEFYFEIREPAKGDEKGEVIYTSKPELNTLNPSWTLRFPREQVVDGTDNILGQCQAFEFFMYSNHPGEDSEPKLIVHEFIDLKLLVPLYLKQLVSLYRLPLNMVLFQLGECGFFVTPDAASILQAATGIVVHAPEATDFSQFSKPYVETFLERLAVTEDTITQTHLERSELQEKFSNILKLQVEKEVVTLEEAQLQKRVQDLRAQCQREEASLKREQEEYNERRDLLKARYKTLKGEVVDASLLLEVKSPAKGPDGLGDENGTAPQLRRIQQQCRIREVKILIELKRMYPIFPVTGQSKAGQTIYSIRGLHLPLKNLTGNNEEIISTALGYVCHLVSLLSDFFNIPLRYKLVSKGSRSCVNDEFVAPSLYATSPVREFPLYWTGNGNRADFDIAKRYLEHCVDRLLSARKIKTTNRRMLGKLMEFFEKEFCK